MLYIVILHIFMHLLNVCY